MINVVYDDTYEIPRYRRWVPRYELRKIRYRTYGTHVHFTYIDVPYHTYRTINTVRYRTINNIVIESILYGMASHII